MAHPSSDNRLCSPGMVRLVLFLVSLCLVGFTLRRQMLMHSTTRATSSSSCSLCECDCSPLPTSLDCAEDDPEMSEEMKKDIVTLLTEEIILQKTVKGDSLAHTKAMIMDAKKTSSHYQKEAEKCNTGMETCEEAREKAIATLSEERKLSELWEMRARENGWQD